MYATSGLPADQRRALGRIAARGPRVRVGDTIVVALLRARLIYVVSNAGRRYIHLTDAGREAAKEI
jgi:hypothetical protein